MFAEQITTDWWLSVGLVKRGDDHGIWEGTRRMRIYPQGLLEGGEETELPEASLAFGRRF